MDFLTKAELYELKQHETTIKRGLGSFFEVGAALQAIREKQLYRAEFASFEEYCLERWDFSRGRAYQLMDAATIRDQLEAEGAAVLPQNESQVRPLTKLKTAKQRLAAWEVARQMSTIVDKPPSQSAVQRAVSSKLPKDDSNSDRTMHQCECGHWHYPLPEYVPTDRETIRPGKTEQNSLIAFAEKIFTNQAGVRSPQWNTLAGAKEGGKRWRPALLEICDMTGWNRSAVDMLITTAVQRSRISNLTIDSPASIIRIARSIHGEGKTHEFKPGRFLDS